MLIIRVFLSCFHGYMWKYYYTGTAGNPTSKARCPYVVPCRDALTSPLANIVPQSLGPLALARHTLARLCFATLLCRLVPYCLGLLSYRNAHLPSYSHGTPLVSLYNNSQALYQPRLSFLIACHLLPLGIFSCLLIYPLLLSCWNVYNGNAYILSIRPADLLTLPLLPTSLALFIPFVVKYVPHRRAM